MKIKKKTAYILITFTFILLILSHTKMDVEVSANEQSLNLVDPKISDQTKALFSYFQSINGEHVLFGQQHAIDEGLTLTNDPPRTASEQSEILHAVGDYPAIFGWDTLSIVGDEKPGVEGDVAQSIKNLVASMEKADELGGVIALSMHPKNFATGGRYNDTSGNTVPKILPGGPNNDDFNAWLDNIAKLAHSVKDENDNPIPIIFRPFHEQTGGWFWWGAHQTTPEEYKALYRYTVEYLRDEKGVHNFLYAFSPGAGPAGDLDRYLETYPGDEYVDILGIDNYDDKNNAGSESWLNGLVKDLAMLVDLAEERGKVAALTEYGYSASGINEKENTLDWYTRVLNAIQNDPKASKIAYMQTWANFGWPNNMFVPYKDIHDDLGGDHELLPDFQAFKESDYSAFREDIQEKVYTEEHKNSPVATEGPTAHIASPVSGTTITDNSTKFRVRVLHDNPQQVTYTIEGSDQAHSLTLDADSNYYVADWMPTTDMNGTATNITFKVVHQDGSIYEETVKVFVKASSLPSKLYTFDDNIDGIKTNGTHPVTNTITFEHATLADDGKLKFQIEGMDANETWQELKLELTDLSEDDLQAINQVELEALLPVSVGDGSIQAVAMLPDDLETKYGMNETSKDISDLEEVTINGETFKKYHTSINVPDTIEARTIAISLVGNQLDLTDAIYIDHIKLNNTYVEAPIDPLLVDNLEGYLGDDSLLENAYSSNGDKVTLHHSSENKNEGEYGLAYNFTIAGMGYAGRQTSLANVDWSETNAFQFWLKNDSYPNDLTIQIQIGGISFEAYHDLDEPSEGIITIPFTKFTPAAWENKPDVVVDKEKLTNVTQFAIYTGGEEGRGTLYFDDMRAIYDEAQPEVPEAVETPEDEERNPVLFDFEDGELAWNITSGTAEEPSIVENGINGSSLKTTLDLTSNDSMTISTTSITDLSNEKSLSAKVHLSEGQAQAKFFVKTGEDWAWADGGVIDLNSGDVTTLLLDLTTIESLDNVGEIGLELIPVEGDTTATILMDDVLLTDGSETPDPEQEEPTEDIHSIDNKETFTKEDNSYQFDLTTKKVEITKDIITQLEHDATVQLNYKKTTVTIPVQLLQSYNDNITFAFNQVSEDIKEKRKDVLSDLIDFQLFAGEQEITEFEQPINITYTLDADQEFDANKLQVILVDENGELVTEQRFQAVWNEETKRASADVTHFSIYGAFEYKEEEQSEEAEQDPDSNESDESANHDNTGAGQKDESKNNLGINNTDSNSDQDQSLPDTATHTANWLLAGLLLTLSGIVTLVMARRKKVQ
ncbi:mannan endo-1,4-beta-mannosidase [Gracilibacillus orientalis]|uniref:Mannan endo-1,4-beta-mannosidase n=1 Tax=Gracilibacillus orientalis TaxID=334253 RepID=A0A1I4HP69_9BACI|nr:glycosyl hydrolase [Gracilibacillus orientalis]SFL43351.1 mannan endo-1,4-beta-mannosidase [Gracilibacillus orientalis]